MIHQTAIIDSKSKLHSSVSIGAYSVIGPGVEIHEETEVQHHAVIEGPTKIGKRCRIFPFASIGLDPQDKKFHGEESYLEIGDGNTVREFVTINRGTELGGGITRIGNRCWIMACCHIAHDCTLGNDITMSNGATLGGHVMINNYAVIGGLTGIHQFCSIGDYALTGGQSKVAQDVAPFSMATGNHARLSGVNYVWAEKKRIFSEHYR